MSEASFTGERLHDASELFAVDLARHRAAYEFARSRPPPGREDAAILDLGSGSGYGVANLARSGVAALGVDRVAPDRSSRAPGASFVRADLFALPFEARFPRVVSFQVIEHFLDPDPYLEAAARLVAPDGELIVTTPNRLTSDGVNPYHLREYTASELQGVLGRYFGDVALFGVGATPSAAAWYADRAQRVDRIMRLDPLRLHRLLPRRWLEWLFARAALLVRSRARNHAGVPDVTWRDFPVGDADDDCLDLLAVSRSPQRNG